MKSLVAVALVNSLSKQIKDIKIPVGTHHINETVCVTVTGTITKGADVEYTPTIDIPLLTTMALVLEKAGFQRENAKKLLIEAMQEAIALDEKGSEHVAAQLKNIESAMKHVREVTNSLPLKMRQGCTKVKVQLNENQLADAA